MYKQTRPSGGGAPPHKPQMTLTSIRRGAPSLHGLSRHYSTHKAQKGKAQISLKTSSSSIPSHTTLPPAKLRALIALYHQADSWVTLENLNAKIDEAFVPPKVVGQGVDIDTIQQKEGRIDVSVLEKARYSMDIAPKMAQWDRSRSQSGQTGQTSWAVTASKRELKVIEALYGISATKTGDLLPGLPVLEETSATLDREDTIFEKEQ